MSEHERTRVAYVWWCGDYWCDCTRPVVEDRWKNIDGYWQTDRVWEGTFMTAGDGDRSIQTDELRKAAKEYGAIPAQPRPVDLPTGPQKSPRGDHHE